MTLSIPLGDTVQSRLEREFLKLHRKCVARRLNFCTRPTIVPTADFFPRRARGDIAAAEELAGQLGRFCDVAHCKFSVREVCDVDASIRSTLPRYSSERTVFHSALELGRPGEFTIYVLPAVLENRKLLASELLRRIAEVTLKQRLHVPLGRPNRSGFLIDIACIYLGCGIIAANGVFEFQKRSVAGAYEWSAHQSGSLGEPEYGYALALYAAGRGERNPDWARYLDPNVRSAFGISARFLRAKRDADLLRLCH